MSLIPNVQRRPVLRGTPSPRRRATLAKTLANLGNLGCKNLIAEPSHGFREGFVDPANLRRPRFSCVSRVSGQRRCGSPAAAATCRIGDAPPARQRCGNAGKGHQLSSVSAILCLSG